MKDKKESARNKRLEMAFRQQDSRYKGSKTEDLVERRMEGRDAAQSSRARDGGWEEASRDQVEAAKCVKPKCVGLVGPVAMCGHWNVCDITEFAF